MKSLDCSFISSLCALVAGVLLVVWPDQAVNYLVITIGILFLLPGLVGILSYFAFMRKRRQDGVKIMFPVIALGSAILGMWLIITPEFFATILMYVLGFLLLLGGLNQLCGLMSARSSVHIPIVMYLFSIFIMFAGLTVLFDPFGVLRTTFIMLGVSFIVYSLIDILRLLRFRRKADNIQDITPLDE